MGAEYETLRYIEPQFASYGNTNVNYYGSKIKEGLVKSTDINASGLSLTQNVGGVEFTNFEKAVYDFILARLGHPVVRVELTPFQIKTCIDEAYAKLDAHAPYWATQIATFQTVYGCGLYKIPIHIMNGLTYVVYKKGVVGIQGLQGSFEQDFFIRYFQENLVLADFEVADFYIFQMHLEMARKVLGMEGSWDVIGNQYLQLYPIPSMDGETVILMYRALNTESMHPYYRIWIQKYATAVAKGILGGIRGKYDMLPGPGGGAKLDGALLKEESAEEMAKLEQQVIDELEEPPMMSIF